MQHLSETPSKGSSRLAMDHRASFFADTVKQLAQSYASIPSCPWRKVEKLFEMCPAIPAAGFRLSINRRNVNAVTALGSYIFKSDYHHQSTLIPYLLDLVGALQDIDQVLWMDGEALLPNDGLLAEDLSFNLCLLMTEVARHQDDWKKSVCDALLDWLRKLTEYIQANCEATNEKKQSKLCFAALPSLFGVLRALSGTLPERVETCNSLFATDFPVSTKANDIANNRRSTMLKSIHGHPLKDGSVDSEAAAAAVLRNRRKSKSTTAFDEKTEPLLAASQALQLDSIWSIQHVQVIVKTILSTADQAICDKLDASLEDYRTVAPTFPHTTFSDELIFHILSLARDVLAPHRAFSVREFAGLVQEKAQTMLSVGQSRVFMPRRTSEPDLTSANQASLKQRLQPGTAAYSSRIDAMASALDLLVWSCTSETGSFCSEPLPEPWKGADSILQILTNQLAEQASARFELSHLALRFAALSGMGTIAESFPHLASICLETISDYLTDPSPLLVRLNEKCQKGGPQSTMSTEKFKFSAGATTTDGATYHRNELRKIVDSPMSAVAQVVELLCNLAVENIVRCIRAGARTNPEKAGAFVSAMATKLYTLENRAQGPVFELVGRNLVALLGQQARIFHQTSGVSDLVFTAFQQRLAHPPSKVDNMILEELAGLMVVAGGKYQSRVLEVYRLVLESSISATYDPNSSAITYTHCSQSVYTGLENVAGELKTDAEKEQLLQRVLDLFVQQALDGKKQSEKASATTKASSQSFHLGFLLSILAKLLFGLPAITSSAPRIRKRFFDFWQFAVAYGFASANSAIWPEEWTRAIQHIAIKSPHLLLGFDYLKRELMHNSVLRDEHVSVAELNDLRATLRTQLCSSAELDVFINKLGPTLCVYILSIYYLEQLRVQEQPSLIVDLFVYLEDRGIRINKDGLQSCVAAVAERIFQQYLDIMAARVKSISSEKELEDVAIYLLVQFNNKLSKRVARLADSFFSNMAERFPHVLWNRRIIFALLDMLAALTDVMKDETSAGRSFNMDVPGTVYKIIIPEEPDSREQTVRDFSERCGEILAASMKHAPKETRLQLLDYMLLPQHATLGLVTHVGVALAAEILLANTGANSFADGLSPAALEKLPNCITQDASYSPSLLALISKHTGEVSGMRAVWKSTCAENSNRSLTRVLTEKLVEAEQAFRAGTGSEQDYTTAMFRLAAQFISLPGIDRSLLHHLVHSPVRLFTGASMTTAISCWRWIMASRPEAELPLVRVMAMAWRLTIDQRVGLFTSGEQPPVSFLSFRKCEQVTPDVSAHNVWIKFLVDYFEVMKTRSTDVIDIMLNLLHQSMSVDISRSNPKKTFLPLIRHVSAAGARFRLLQLGLSMVQSSKVQLSLSSNLLRVKLYSTALDYFSMAATWPTQTAATLREDITVLIRVWQLFSNERKFLQDMNHPVLAPIEPTSSDTPSASSGLALMNYDDRQQGWMNVKPVAPRQRSLVASNSGLADVSDTISLKSDGQPILKHFQRQRILVLSLLQEEIERLSTWHNPLGSPELAFKNEEVVHSWNINSVAAHVWVDCCRLAWDSSPHLAVELVNRLGSIETIRREVPRLVQSNPLPVVSVEDALQLFTGERLLQSDVVELTHVLCWTDVPAITVLAFLSNLHPPNILTAQYTVRVLRNCPVDEILYYIPQLVQAVRYDKMGYVTEFITWAAKKSQLLAHQFIWNMKTNMFTDEDSKHKDPDLYDVLANLVDRITSDLSGPSLAFFQRQFAFVKEVTEVSGTIKPYPKGPERKQACLEALSTVKPPPGVYLPSNPEAIVTDLDNKSGIPLSSAAKAPYLAKFRVQRCGIDELEKLNEDLYYKDRGEQQPDISITSDTAAAAADTFGDTVISVPRPLSEGDPTYWQAAIFKVGDDVRQDMLALQVIGMFKRVFDGVGLPLFMYPYRVVAIAPGCGVIECVPNSKSRDQLGQSTEATLTEYFIQQYGAATSAKFQEARRHFITSMAAYSLLTFMLQIKDRHNGNIMLDEIGHIIHIDFGFMLESSPGGNLGFEPDFKLSPEMVGLMGGDENAAPFKVFMELCIRGYLSVRSLNQQLVALVALMLDTGLPCFRGNTIEPLRTRLQPQQPPRVAANYMRKVINDSYLSYRTQFYDYLQKVQNNYYF
ncbi:phosphatidylinositol 4-kinase alpha-like isoform X1 [Sycon ciliatum]|uniref:phosphatidylinositol 4-kinase alpha-like isoform X1 n=1 Tax=Sycon ciliatum TaxID=27933 RepID=UPI0031F6DA91